MRERVLAIVTILARYFLEERSAMTETELVEELLSSGFEADEIDAAFSWMQELSTETPVEDDEAFSIPAQRIFTAEETRLLDADSRGFLTRLHSIGLLSNLVLEEIIERAYQLGEEQVCLKEIKAVTALTLFAHSNEDWRREIDCLMAEDWYRLFH